MKFLVLIIFAVLPQNDISKPNSYRVEVESSLRNISVEIYEIEIRGLSKHQAQKVCTKFDLKVGSLLYATEDSIRTVVNEVSNWKSTPLTKVKVATACNLKQKAIIRLHYGKAR